MRVGGAAHVHLIGPTREVSGPGAHERAQARIRGPTCARVHEGKPPSGQAAANRARVCGERTSSEQFRMQFD